MVSGIQIFIKFIILKYNNDYIKSENIINIEYTDKVFYINTEKVKLYIDFIKDKSDIILNIKY